MMVGSMAYKSAFSLFSPSKDAVFNNPLAFFIIIFLPSFLSVVANAMDGNKSPFFSLNSSQSEASQLLSMIGGLLSLVLLAPGIYIELKAAKGKAVSVSEALNNSMRYFWRLLGLVIVLAVVIGLGLIALIVPGIIFIQRYFLAPYFLVDKNLGIKQAMRASAAASKGNGMAVWSVIGVMVLLSLSNLIPIFGGLIALVLVTLYTCAPAYRYYELTAKKSP